MAKVLSFFKEEIDLESERARHLFTQSGWNTIVRASGQNTGVKFLENYVILRWNKGYALSQLLYDKGGARPFYTTGQWVSATEAGATVQAVATKGDVRVTIRLPVGHPLASETSRGFRKVTAREAEYAKKTFREELVKAIDTTPVTKPARINGKARAQVSSAISQGSRTRASSLIFNSRAQAARISLTHKERT